ncbi:hypothetical protein T281_07530 [Rhodomicrobium udaipurense JA643]|uniref:Class I SAM-dependent methyltransferase n=1 Tax=Rhodomicrobium udaipurense TaxID=1202716 RepID=A0A8I1GIV5_9HYPH|nr:class I SAM-dependent methyltransferase [Rhodomicrobium udaipurense]KAI95062.1 hypothetical protein T281_07530 [Rhodomicrobium udaipurense JA643]MBJ7544252.1 class I SAM-dependent methyltransferase [Rhodomicrobium udaipurense]
MGKKTLVNKYLRDFKNIAYPNRVLRRMRGQMSRPVLPPVKAASRALNDVLQEAASRSWQWSVVDDEGVFNQATLSEDWFGTRGAWSHFLKEGANDVGEYLEIGSFEGRSALFAASLFPNARLTCIDPFGGSDEHTAVQVSELEKRFLGNIQPICDRVRVLKGTSLRWLPTFEDQAESFDVIYVDGCHFYRHVMLDSLMAWPLLKVGGILIWDDYIWSFKPYSGMVAKPAIEQFLDMYRGDYEVIFVTNQVAIRKTRSELRYFAND